MSKLSLFFIRLPLAFSMLGHALVRLPKLQGFSKWMVSFMEKSYLPKSLIIGFSYLVPFLELIIGLCLLMGICTKFILYLGLTLMAFFILGNTTIENWDAINSELLHAIYIVVLLYLNASQITKD